MLSPISLRRYLHLCSPCGTEHRMLMSLIAEMFQSVCFVAGLCLQSHTCSQLNEMCPAASKYISRDEETFLLSILLMILPFCA